MKVPVDQQFLSGNIQMVQNHYILNKDGSRSHKILPRFHNHPTKPRTPGHTNFRLCIYIHGFSSAKLRVEKVLCELASFTEMALRFSLKPCVVVLYVFLISYSVLVRDVDAAGECGRTPIRSAAASLSPCLGAAGNAKAKVPPAWCSKVAALLKTTPKCLCAILLSPLAKQAGIKPGIAIGIPKRLHSPISNQPYTRRMGYLSAYYCFSREC
ncbi:Bifunctional inhibitor/plant lipid transfer protein/seed storage helical domain - like 10 [Theobroma cacao]|nr:Bifunctional inhibitor/plant lipid transfer protein/seed storage helical domain - like 10 [Theobroma cacao]